MKAAGIFGTILLLVCPHIFSQALYEANGQYRGYQQTSPSGGTTTYNQQGQSTGSSQVDAGQTSYYSSSGTYRGTNITPPSPMQPNTTINTPRQAPQAPVMKGW